MQAECNEAVESEEPQTALTSAKLSRGDPLPTFRAQAVDCWGNRTSPARDLPCNMVLECQSLEPAQLVAACNDAGIAVFEGMQRQLVQ